MGFNTDSAFDTGSVKLFEIGADSTANVKNAGDSGGRLVLGELTMDKDIKESISHLLVIPKGGEFKGEIVVETAPRTTKDARFKEQEVDYEEDHDANKGTNSELLLPLKGLPLHIARLT